MTSFTFVGNEDIYIVWVKDKKVIFKILQAESFAGTSRDGLSREALTKCSLTLNSSASRMCFLCAPFVGTLLANMP